MCRLGKTASHDRYARLRLSVAGVEPLTLLPNWIRVALDALSEGGRLLFDNDQPVQTKFRCEIEVASVIPAELSAWASCWPGCGSQVRTAY